jgi:lipopolysaccharide/colanic/teichoic acid biosynthesis glycosyltransferase
MHITRTACVDTTQLSLAREAVAAGHSRRNAATRRLADIVLGLALLAFTLPLMVLMAVLIRIDSPGPALYRQQRVGLHGRRFTLLKFRPMRTDAEARGPVWAAQSDPRATRIGPFIRLVRIDELPQLLNVLRGDMSVVGPRPAVPSEVARYEAWQRRRLSVRPGLTCVWQVSGRDHIPFGTWMLLDMRYIDHWSLWEDLRLILQTVPVVLMGRGAS